MFNKYRKKNNSKMERILYYIACELDLRPSELKELIYVSTETKMNQICLRHKKTNKELIIQCDAAYGWCTQYLHDAWDGGDSCDL